MIKYRFVIKVNDQYTAYDVDSIDEAYSIHKFVKTQCKDKVQESYVVDFKNNTKITFIKF